MNLKDIQQKLMTQEEDSIKLLKRFVEIESFSYDKQGIDNLCRVITNIFQELPVSIEELQEETLGNHLRITYGEGNRQITILSHLDTVYPRGTLEIMPFRLDGNKVSGPGVYDMKVSYVMMYHLFKLLRENKGPGDDVRIVWLLTSDEEIGSPSGKHHVYREADKSEVILVLEPTGGDGALKTSRKGGGKFRIEVKGISAHAGVNPEEGANAIEELVYQISKIAALADSSKGTSINTGEIRGGTLFNVVAEHAVAEVDVRVLIPSEAERIENAFKSLTVNNPKTSLSVEGSIYRPPMIRTDKTGVLFNLACAVAEEIGLTLSEVMTGGGSDGNYAASRGVPVLDGLGVVGGYAHSPEEFLWKDTIAERTSLLYGLVLSLIRKQHWHIDNIVN
ncbi:M20 family metallopeptidase [Peribacillus saganii]|nr:M20 family metallopeptidase [Peribacillus saganii]